MATERVEDAAVKKLGAGGLTPEQAAELVGQAAEAGMAMSRVLVLRAVLAEWGDDSAAFLGAVESPIWEAILEDDENEETDRWGERVRAWRDQGPAGAGEIREVDLTLEVPADLFSTPLLSASVQQPEGSEHGSE